MSSPVYLGEERLTLTRTGIKVPVEGILGGCGLEMVLGILVGWDTYEKDREADAQLGQIENLFSPSEPL